MFPPQSLDLFTGFGRDIVIQDEYLITSAEESDSLGYLTGLIFVYEFNGVKWEKVADLTPTIPIKGLQLGSYIRASANIITAEAVTYSESGNRYEVIYVFQKDSHEKWTSRHESYILNSIPEINDAFSGSASITFDIRQDTLWVYHLYTYFDLDYNRFDESENRLYKIGSSSATLFESIPSIQNEDAEFYYHPNEIQLKFGENFMVFGLENYQFSDQYASGKVMVYNYDNLVGWDATPIELTRSYERQLGFGTAVDVYSNTIFVTNLRDERYNSESEGKVFIYEKSGDQWVSSNEDVVLSIPNQSGSSHDQIVANETYVVHAYPGEQRLHVFTRKGSSWQSQDAPDFQIDIASELRGFGWEMAMSNNHFVYNSNDFAFSESLVNGSELYAVSIDDDFVESQAAYDQIITQRSITSSGDEFSRNSAFYKSSGVVGSNLDNDRGVSSGALYLYERNNEDLSWSQTDKIYSPNTQAFQSFGSAVTMSENYLFASSPYYDSIDSNGENAIFSLGKVYQFKRDGNAWEYLREIISPDIAIAGTDTYGLKQDQKTKDDFKFSNKSITGFKALSRNDYLPISSFSHFLDSATSEKIQRDSDFDQYRQFGKSIAHHNGYLAIGQRYSGGSNYKGRIYIFKEKPSGEWDHIATLQTSNTYTRDYLGQFPFVMNDSLIVAGCPTYANHVFIFKRDPEKEWQDGVEDAVLLPDRSKLISSGNFAVEEFDGFGLSVDMYKDVIVVGAPTGERDDRLGPNSGRAYIFEMPPGGWNGEITYQHILKPEDRILEGHFGYSVYVDQNNVLVGSPHSIHRRQSASSLNTDGVDKQGSVYVFDRSLFQTAETVIHEVGKILPIGGHSFDLFGAKIEKNFIEVVVSSPLSNTENGDRSGSAYMFKKVGAIEEDVPPLCREAGVIDLIAYPVTGGTWSGQGIVNANKGIFDPSMLEEGLHTVRYQYGECTTTTDIAVYSKPVIVDSSEPMNILCQDGTVELFVISDKSNHDYKWFYKPISGNSYTDLPEWENERNITVSEPGYYYSIALNPACNSEPIHFEVINPNISAMLNVPSEVQYCIGEQHALELISDNTIEYHHWFYSTDMISPDFISISSQEEVQVSSSGLYFCEYEARGCIFYTDTVRIDFKNQVTKLSLTDYYDLCQEETVNISLEDEQIEMMFFEWFGDTLGFGEYVLLSNDKSLEVNQKGEYYCRSTSLSGCTYYSDTLVVSQEPITVNFESIEPICSNARPIEFNVSPPGGLFTIINSDLNSFESTELDPKILNNGIYEVMYEYNHNHCSYQAYQTIEIAIINDEEVFIPNVFTPNDDGLNEHFEIKHLGIQPQTFRVVIFNRAGTTVFVSNNSDFRWGGSNLPEDIYYWSILYGNNCESRQLKGYVQLLR